MLQISICAFEELYVVNCNGAMYLNNTSPSSNTQRWNHRHVPFDKSLSASPSHCLHLVYWHGALYKTLPECDFLILYLLRPVPRQCILMIWWSLTSINTLVRQVQDFMTIHWLFFIVHDYIKKLTGGTSTFFFTSCCLPPAPSLSMHLAYVYLICVYLPTNPSQKSLKHSTYLNHWVLILRTDQDPNYRGHFFLHGDVK